MAKAVRGHPEADEVIRTRGFGMDVVEFMLLLLVSRILYLHLMAGFRQFCSQNAGVVLIAWGPEGSSDLFGS